MSDIYLRFMTKIGILVKNRDFSTFRCFEKMEQSAAQSRAVLTFLNNPGFISPGTDVSGYAGYGYVRVWTVLGRSLVNRK